jgi:hypothetical protein
MWNFVQTWNPTCFRKCNPSVSASNQFALNSFVVEAACTLGRRDFRARAENIARTAAKFFAAPFLQPNAGAFLEPRAKAAAAHDAAAA